MRLDRNRIDRIEKDISPPMKYAITIPVECSVDGICIYVAVSPFVDAGSAEIFEALQTLRRVADSLALGGGYEFHN